MKKCRKCNGKLEVISENKSKELNISEYKCNKCKIIYTISYCNCCGVRMETWRNIENE